MKKDIRAGKTMQMLNIVLLHNQQPESYIDLFERLLQEDYVVKLTGESYIELIALRKMSHWDMYEGEIVSYIGVRNNAWFNQKSKEIETYEGREDLFANTKKATFFFIPQCHKLCLLSGSEISLQNIKKFIDNASCRLLGEGQVHTNYITSKDEIKDAYQDVNINRVRLTINYSNKDYSEDFERTFDDLAKQGNVAQINMDITSAEGEDLLLDKGGMIDSLLNLATSLGNGYADISGYRIIPPKKKSAKVRKKRERIRTSDYISTFPLEYGSYNELFTGIYNMVMTIFKRDEKDEEK